MFSSGPRRVLYWWSSQCRLVTRLGPLGSSWTLFALSYYFFALTLYTPNITTRAKMANVKSKTFFLLSCFRLLDRCSATDQLTLHKLSGTGYAGLCSALLYYSTLMVRYVSNSQSFQASFHFDVLRVGIPLTLAIVRANWKCLWLTYYSMKPLDEFFSDHCSLTSITI